MPPHSIPCPFEKKARRSLEFRKIRGKKALHKIYQQIQINIDIAWKKHYLTELKN